MTATAAAPVLHMPEEPTVLAERWLSASSTARRSTTFCAATRVWWTGSGPAGASSTRPGCRDDLALVVTSYQREVWLWLAGERTWAQCCSGLIGRIGRRLGDRAGA